MAANKKPHHHNKNYNPALNVMRWANMDKHIVQMFAAFAIALKECIEVDGKALSNDDVEAILGKVQAEWNDSVNYNYDIADKCYSLYDIDVRRAGG